ncbi:hypothetical protein LEN26_017246 [Aphanomyces euteiches]|nr:hypothetical protein LEN26_017246 [Aphanomyces euteiches]
MEAFMKLVPNGIAYIYLVDTNQCEDDKRLFKFGRTTNVKDRFYSHASSFGDDCRLDTLVLVPLNILSAAKTQFKRMIADMFRCPSGNTQELLVLDTDGYNVIRECMQTVADTYNGNLALHSHILDSKVKQVQNQMHELCLKANCGSRVYARSGQRASARQNRSARTTTGNSPTAIGAASRDCVLKPKSSSSTHNYWRKTDA